MWWGYNFFFKPVTHSPVTLWNAIILSVNSESQSVQLGCVVTLVLVIVTALHVLIWNQSLNSEECKYTCTDTGSLSFLAC